MEQRLKERLTGAAILVALIVLIVPELFHGHLSERPGKAASSTDGPPLRSYLIDLGGEHSAPMQLGAASARGLPTAPAGTSGSGTEGASAAPGSIPEAAASSPAPAPSAGSAPAASVSRAPSGAGPAEHHARTVVARTAAPGSGAKAVGRSPSSGDAVKATDWSVQLGLYAKRVNAEHMVHVAHTKGFTASFGKPDAKGRYRVRVAGLTSRSAALTLAARLRAAGLPAAAVGPR